MNKKKGWILSLVGVVLLCALVLAGVPQKAPEAEVDMNEIVTVYCLSEVRCGRDGEEKRTTYTFEYDENGNMLSKTTYWNPAFERTPSTMRYEFDERGNLTRLYDGATEKLAYVYDEEGRVLTEIKSTTGGKVYERNDYTYDDAGRVLTQTVLLYGNDFKIVNTYDSQGNHIRRERFDDGKLTSSTDYTYDAAGRKLSSVNWPAVVESGADAWFWEYDSKGNVVSYKYCQGEKVRTHKTSTYDSFGRLKTTKTVEDGEVTYEATYFYDLRGNLIRIEARQGAEMYIDDPGPLRSLVITYQYDQYGNMVERVKKHEGFGTDVWTYVYDERGNLLVEEVYGTHTERTYDEYGNVLTRTKKNEYGETVSEYTYVAFQVPRWLAEKIMAWQAEFEDLDFA